MKVAPLRLPPTPPISASPSTSLPPKSSPSPFPCTHPHHHHHLCRHFPRKGALPRILGLGPLRPRGRPLGLLRSLGFSTADFRRILSMCPDLLSPSLSAAALPPSLTFLLREAGVDARFLRRAVSRRPRLLASDVDRRLHLALFFLRSLGTPTFSPAPSTRSSSPVSTTLRESASTAATPSPCSGGSPSCSAAALGTPSSPNSITSWWKWAGMRELKEFPQYFSFSLDNRIKPRYRMCVDKGVVFPLPLVLKTKEAKFRERLDVCWSSSPPWRSSPLWGAISDSD